MKSIVIVSNQTLKSEVCKNPKWPMRTAFLGERSEKWLKFNRINLTLEVMRQTSSTLLSDPLTSCSQPTKIKTRTGPKGLPMTDVGVRGKICESAQL